MPFLLQETDVIPELAKFKSVLIVPCRFCPAASSAVNTGEPYLKLYRGSLKTASYERSISALQSGLEARGVKTGIFRTRLVHQFVMCMWTPRRRSEFLKHAKKYEALVVLGCEGAVKTVYDTVKSSSCQVFQGMETLGLMVVTPRIRLPGTLSITLDSLTPITHQKPHSEPWHRP